MPRVFVSIGSNIDRINNIRGAVRELTAHYGVLTLSCVYESKAIGVKGENFYNLVVSFDTAKSIQQIKVTLFQIELLFGRTRQGNRFSSLTLDLNLLLYDDVVQHNDQIPLPHPDIERYAFVLAPLADIAPSLRHPQTGLAYAQMWAQFDKNKQEMQVVDFRV